MSRDEITLDTQLELLNLFLKKIIKEKK